MHKVQKNKKAKNSLSKFEEKKLFGPFYGWGSTASRLEPLWEISFFLPLSSQKFLVPILSTLEGWKAESTLEPPSGLEHGRISKSNVFIDKYNLEEINYPSEKNDWTKFEKNNWTIGLNLLYAEKEEKNVLSIFQNTTQSMEEKWHYLVVLR